MKEHKLYIGFLGAMSPMTTRDINYSGIERPHELPGRTALSLSNEPTVHVAQHSGWYERMIAIEPAFSPDYHTGDASGW